MAEKIIPVDLVEQHNVDTAEYSTYIALKRVIPDLRDGLKTVHRRILHTLYNDLHKTPTSSYTKTARVTGAVIGLYHPHGDAAIAEAMKPMTNDFECKVPYLDGSGTWGNPLGLRMASPRYTETRLSEYAHECIISDMKDSKNCVDWEPNYSEETVEPCFLPAAVPNLLINGAYGIASGLAVDIPRHNFNEVIDATIALMHNPKYKVVLVPDNCMETEIIDTDWKTICNTGKGQYKVRAKVEICEHEKKKALKITSVPDMVFFDSIWETIDKMIESNKLPQVDKIYDLSEDGNMSIYITLKKDADPNYVRDLLFSSTSLEKGRGVNFEVLVPNPGSTIPVPKLMSYTEYLKDFIEFRALTKFRIYCNIIKDARTKCHKMELYIKAVESGEIDNIIAMIKKQKGTDDTQYIEYFVKKLKVTDAQAKFLLSTDIRKLSVGYLQEYKRKRDEYLEKFQYAFNMLNDPNLIMNEIEQELLAYKKKFGKPRMSKIISAEEAMNIPKGEFKVVITNSNKIRKFEVGANVTGLNGDIVVSEFNADNADSLLIFGSAGKVFKLPISNIPFTMMDIRKLLKNFTADITAVILESKLRMFGEDPENFVFTLSKNGYIKRMNCMEFVTAPPSGLVYAKLEDLDCIVDVLFMNVYNDLIMYSHNKALRIPGTEAPLFMRSTKGNYAMAAKSDMMGMDVIHDATGVIAVTENGYINYLPLTEIPQAKRGRAGNTIVRVKPNDKVVFMKLCNKDINSIIVNNVTIPIHDVPTGAGGKKMVPHVKSVNII